MRSTINQLATIAIVLIVFFMNMKTVETRRVPDKFFLAQVSVQNHTTSAVTTLMFQLQIMRSSNVQVQEGDTIVFELPEDSTAIWDQNKQPVCKVESDAPIRSCSILSQKKARIRIGAQKNLVLFGSISQFKNPHSTKGVDGITVSLQSDVGQVKVEQKTLSVNSMVAGGMSAELTSSSQTVGALEETLFVKLQPWSLIAGEGTMVINVPAYYQGATNEFSFNSLSPTPCGLNATKFGKQLTTRIKSCTFSRQRRVEISYIIGEGQDLLVYENVEISFSVARFNNPITMLKEANAEGFGIEIHDKAGYAVANTGMVHEIQGITQPAKFAEYDFLFADIPNSNVTAAHTLTFRSAMPVQYHCIFRIVYPPQMVIGKNLQKMTGTGFLESPTLEHQFTVNHTDNSVTFQACQVNYGQVTVGSITLQNVRNQPYIMDLPSFKIYMTQASDEDFKHVYQRVTEGFSVQTDQMKAGLMLGYITPSSLKVQTPTRFTFVLTPSSSLSTKAFIEVRFPDTLDFQQVSCTVSDTHGFGPNIKCRRNGHTANITELFLTPYVSDPLSPLKMTIESLQMPTSEQRLGKITVHSFDEILGVIREVDVTEFADLSSTPGEINMVSPVGIGGTLASAPGQTYTFDFRPEHYVPVGGHFLIILSSSLDDGVKIPNVEEVLKHCFLVRGGAKLAVTCKAGIHEFYHLPFISVQCTEEIFGAGGSARGASVKFEVGGLTNPRAVGYKNTFMIKTVDQDQRAIDVNKKDQFVITMNTMSKIQAVGIRMSNQLNGAAANYSIDIVHSTRVYSGDTFSIKFPKEVGLPPTLSCRAGGTTAYIRGLKCTKQGDNLVLLNFTSMLFTHKGGQPLEVIVEDVTNPRSTRPTSPFDNMLITGQGGFKIADYPHEIKLKTDYLGSIKLATASISQSSYAPDARATVTLKFTTNNPLPSNAAILVQVPDTLQNLYASDPTSPSCAIRLNGDLIDNMQANGQPVCTTDVKASQVIYRGAFLSRVIGFNYVGKIELLFQTRNPKENSANLSKKPYKIIIYDSADMNYGIDELDTGLFPSVDCEYPCRECLVDNRRHCTSCLTMIKGAPIFLHTKINTDYQTCVDTCPAANGFTSNGSRNPQRCHKCAPTCKTCAQDDKPGDINRCVTCPKEFPYLWINKETCHSERCPDGSYLSDTERCTTCPAPCQTCSNRLTCTKCYANMTLAFLYEGQCLTGCPKGYTSIDNVCTKCESPCATCMLGSLRSCTSCDNTNGKQFLYGRSCLTVCPVNTTLSYANKECRECRKGCASCDETDNSICLVCSKGLALLNNTCREECPYEYLKSPDGSTCELRTYLLDREFVFFPFLNATAFFILVTLASWWLTGRRSLVCSSLIAFLGPIEMAAVIYQIYYAAKPDRMYKPVLAGSIYCLVAGVIANAVFLVNYHKQVKGKDRQFTRWCDQKWMAANFYLIISGAFSMTLYRLIFCRLFRLDVMSVRVNRPKQFLRPIFIFTWVKFIVFNVPLIIVDFVGTSALDWGNQCYMTMIESCAMSFLSLVLMLLEALFRDDLIVREEQGLKMDKIELLEEQERDHVAVTRTPKISVSDALDQNRPVEELLRQQNRGAISLNKIKFQLQNQVTMGELKDAEAREAPPQNDRDERIRDIEIALAIVRKNKDLLLNDKLDEILEVEFLAKQKKPRKTSSMCDLRSKTHNDLWTPDDDEEEYGKIIRNWIDDLSLKVDEEEKLRDFHEYLDSIRQAEIDKNNKAEQYEDPVDDNVYASPREPEPEVEQTDREIQTEQEKFHSDVDVKGHQRMRAQIRDAVTERLLRYREEQAAQLAQKKRKTTTTRRGKKSYFTNAIDEESDQSQKSDKLAQNKVMTYMDELKNDMLTLAMKIEKEQSLTSIYDLQEAEKERQNYSKSTAALFDEIKDKYNLSDDDLRRLQENNFLEDSAGSQLFAAKGIELSRVSGDLDFTDDEEEENAKFLQRDPEAKRMAELVKMENVQAWIKDQTHAVNQRTFNENDILGNFERDWTGQIKDREYTLRKMHFRDLDGNAVNDRGYLIDEHSGDIRSRYTYDVVFRNIELVSVTDMKANQTVLGNKKTASPGRVELPLPFRLERHNFNPHECLGNFDYKNGKPRILKDSFGNKMDKNFRRVNGAGWLVDDDGNVIDNLGRIRFVKEQLENDEIPELYNFDGQRYNIKDIIGQFDRDKNSKEIVFTQNVQHSKNTSCDALGQKANPKGYLLDRFGNIIHKTTKEVIWRSHELMYNEPPKIFRFTQFSMLWVRGFLDRDVTRNPKHDDKVDLNMQPINTMGYLIDQNENVIDVFNGNVIFKREVLENRYGQEAEIPNVFRSGMLREPERDDVQRWLENRLENAKRQRTAGRDPKPAFGFGYQQAVQDESEESDFDVDADLRRLEENQRRFQSKQALQDLDGKEIDDIPSSEIMPPFDRQRGGYGQGNDDEYPFQQQRQNQIMPGLPPSGSHRANSAFRNAQQVANEANLKSQQRMQVHLSQKDLHNGSGSGAPIQQIKRNMFMLDQ